MKTARELLALPHATVVVDKYSGAVFTVGELQPIVVEMWRSSFRLDRNEEANEFAERFELREIAT